MNTILLSLLACCAWGTSEFLGGMKNRSVPLLVILIGMELSGMLLLVIVLLFFAGDVPDLKYILYAMTAGTFGIIGVASIFHGMSIGTIGVVSTIGATSAIIPVLYDLLTGNRLSFCQGAGIVLAIGGVMLLTEGKISLNKKKYFTASIGFAIAGAFFFGLYFISIDLASNQDPYWAAFFSRVVTITILGIGIAMKRPTYHFTKSDVSTIVVIGLFDACGVVAFNMATTFGLVGIVSVIASLYPMMTIMLARIFLKENMNTFQKIGALGAMAGVALISGG
jgi:drug/metabolite transporter (DMT)-like permease